MTSPARLSDDALDRQIVAALRDVASDWPSVGAMVTALSASPSPADRALAAEVEAFLTGWQPNRPAIP
ncbi:hypothetical protein Q8W71_31275 [Methylobacterium sp. NEAU 140]|uniref:hypothetical protein n=1 Tax=Methylobacterium sp. NEAU 140 TaxID=3064945 RepID=UPI0027326DB9|nr:hypothetical protein [Methylobacterium sp. NEAU 140]MDP4027074.1 hypothetical protein [Methylobacterium sp. NEAU 140]